MTMASGSSVLPMEWLLFCVTAALFTWGHKRSVASASSTESSKQSCPAGASLKNAAFVFIKPHANTAPTQALVRSKILQAGLSIVSEKEILAKEIDDKKLIDQHYYAIASKATILPGKDIPVPKDKFQQAFGESYDQALKENRIVNAMEACAAFGCTPSELDAAWQQTTAIKFGGGFYCGRVSWKNQQLYVFNAFFMSMRSKFVTPGTSIHCYEIEWNPAQMSWKDFRNQFLGPTDPTDAPPNSLRRLILEQFKGLGLSSIPNKGDNGVHASASPFEGLAEKANWLGRSLESEPFGKALLDAGISRQTLLDWSLDPRITLTDGTMGSVFDALEDLDVTECLSKMIELNDVNSNMI